LICIRHLDREVVTMPFVTKKCQPIINANEQFLTIVVVLEIPHFVQELELSEQYEAKLVNKNGET
jgi:hypothetical protein